MLKTRFFTAVVALVVLGVTLFLLPAQGAELVIAAMILAGAWEWSGFLQASTNVVRYLYVTLIAGLMAGFYFLYPTHAEILLQVACVWWFGAFVWTFFFPTPIPSLLRWICGVLVLLPVFAALLFLYRLDAKYLLIALIIVWAADIGAYFSGKAFGRVKLAPQISPGKTWEGVFGGLLLVAILTLSWAFFENRNVMVLLPFCLAVAALSIVGDLTVSMFKRTAGLKDSGKLFPGHGGVLDRIDSISAAAPLFALGLTTLELVQ